MRNRTFSRVFRADHMKRRLPKTFRTRFRLRYKKVYHPIQEETQSWLENGNKRTGRLPPNTTSKDHVSFSISTQQGDTWESTDRIKQIYWELHDYGGQIPRGNVSKELMDDMDSTDPEKNQCLIIHLAAGIALGYVEPRRDYQQRRRIHENCHP